MSEINWLRVQRRLLKLGFNPGPLDGIRGRMTTTAVRRFQDSRGLVSDGIVGPATLGALFGEQAGGEAPSIDTIPWFEEARRLLGTREVVGPGSNPVILEMAETLDIDYEDDDIPWCGLFTGHCVGATLPDEPLPNIVLRARAWETFGMPVEPQVGAVLVFWRRSPASGSGHVGFYAAEDDTAYHVLGGNQSNAVTTARIDKQRFLGARWPVTSLQPEGGQLLADASGELSVNEA